MSTNHEGLTEAERAMLTEARMHVQSYGYLAGNDATRTAYDCMGCDATDVRLSSGHFDTAARLRDAVERIVAARDSAAATRARAEALREVADAQKCGGCKNQGSHRRHCPRHPNYHPWIPLADRAEGIGDSIGEPALANQAWALAGAIRHEMPNHPYRPARLRGDA